MDSFLFFKPLFSITAIYLVVYTSCQLEHGGTIPERCTPNPSLMYRFCCVLPPFFIREVAKECGARFEVITVDQRNNITGFRSHSLDRCDFWLCLLNKYAFLTRDGALDHEKFLKHLDIWVSLNPAFTEVMVDAKLHCRQSFRYYFPLDTCEFFGFHMCIRNYISIYCPVLMPTKECEEQKTFYAECGKYFI